MQAGDRRRRCASACRALYELFVNKWYFDEADRPARRRARPRRSAASPRTPSSALVVDDTIVGGTTGIVRAGSAAVRAAQSGFLRYYAALLLLGVTGVGFYFLLQS